MRDVSPSFTCTVYKNNTFLSRWLILIFEVVCGSVTAAMRTGSSQSELLLKQHIHEFTRKDCVNSSRDRLKATEAAEGRRKDTVTSWVVQASGRRAIFVKASAHKWVHSSPRVLTRELRPPFALSSFLCWHTSSTLMWPGSCDVIVLWGDSGCVCSLLRCDWCVTTGLVISPSQHIKGNVGETNYYILLFLNLHWRLFVRLTWNKNALFFLLLMNITQHLPQLVKWCDHPVRTRFGQGEDTAKQTWAPSAVEITSGLDYSLINVMNSEIRLPLNCHCTFSPWWRNHCGVSYWAAEEDENWASIIPVFVQPLSRRRARAWPQ